MNQTLRTRTLSGCLLLALAAALPLAAQPQTGAVNPDAQTRFLRFVEGEQPWHGRLETSIVSYTNDDGVRVDLVSAIHIADAGYYHALNDYFRAPDAVLYELVVPESPAAAGGGAAGDRSGVSRDSGTATGESMGRAVGGVQQFMKNALDLSFQLEEIDYSPDNFVHADLTTTALAEAMRRRNENIFTILLKVIQADFAERQRQIEAGQAPAAPAINLFTLMAAFLSSDQTTSLKYLVAREMESSLGGLAGLEAAGGISILTDRNDKALQVLSEQLDTTDHRHLSIFYGSGHMTGLEAGLLGMGFRPVEEQWLVAWDVKPSVTAP